MQCNINAKGKAVRLVMGILLAFGAVVVASLSFFELLRGQLWTFISIALLAIGIFCIAEGWAGWCALRAMGFKTRF